MIDAKRFWNLKAALIPLSENKIPRVKGWRFDQNVWINSPETIPTVLDHRTKQQVPVMPTHIGFLTGAPSDNICVIDIDNKKNTPFTAVYNFFEAMGISIDTTLASTTKNKGLHLYVHMDPRTSPKCYVGMTVPGINEASGLDFRGIGGFAVAPGTPGYNWANELSPLNLTPQSHPKFFEWFNDAERKDSTETTDLNDRLFEALSDRGLSKGERNDKVFRIGAKLAYKFSNDPEAAMYLRNFLFSAADRAKPKYRGEEEDAELESIVHRCIQWQKDHVKGILPAETSPTPVLTAQDIPHWYDINQYDAIIHHLLPANELGFTLRLLSFSPNLVWRPDTNSWWYKDVVWRSFSEFQGIENIQQLCLEVIAADKKAGSNPSHTAKLETIVSKLATFEAFLKMLKTKTAVEDDRFNTPQSRNWVGFTNGALNILTKQFLPEVPDTVYATTAFSYDYNPTATLTPAWSTLINYMFQNDPDMVDFMPILMGYWLLGTNKDNKFFLFIGKADAGKSTLSRILCEIFGGNASINVSPYVFAGGNMSEGTRAASLIPAANARLVIADEVGIGDYLKEEDIKRITGGDMITIRENYAKANFSYRAAFTPIMIGNDDPPFFSAASAALRRRIHKIQLNNAVSREARLAHPNLEQDIVKEAPAIMNLILDGIDKYLANGDRIDTMLPKSITANTKQYFEEADVFHGFITEELHFKDPKHKGRAHNMKAAFLAYQDKFMQNEHQKKITVTALNRRLRDAGCTTIRSHGITYWKGVRLRTPTESVNGMVLQKNNSVLNNELISVTFGAALDPLVQHDNNEQDFVGTNLTVTSETQPPPSPQPAVH